MASGDSVGHNGVLLEQARSESASLESRSIAVDNSSQRATTRCVISLAMRLGSCEQVRLNVVRRSTAHFSNSRQNAAACSMQTNSSTAGIVATAGLEHCEHVRDVILVIRLCPSAKRRAVGVGARAPQPGTRAGTVSRRCLE
jgi:hypothetical protein